jgi:hypothetical protein
MLILGYPHSYHADQISQFESFLDKKKMRVDGMCFITLTRSGVEYSSAMDNLCHQTTVKEIEMKEE